MPRYRFQWENVPSELVSKIVEHLCLPGSSIDAIKSRYGMRPKVDFIQDTWKLLVSEWLVHDVDALASVASSLRGIGLGDTKIERDEQYLDSCRNTIRLREVVLDRFIALGESGQTADPLDEVDTADQSIDNQHEPCFESSVVQVSTEEIFRQPDPRRNKPDYINGSYSPSDYDADYEEVIDFPAGKYFLGDPCFAIPEELKELVDDIPYGEYRDISGLGRVAVFHAGGDGCYEDEEGHPHYVESGCLGVIPIDNLSKEIWIKLSSLGRIIDIDSDTRPSMPYVDENGYDTFDSAFQVQSDTLGNLFLGWNWIFCEDDSHLSPPVDEDLDGEDDEDELDRWDMAQNVKRWYEKRVDGLGGAEYSEQAASFVQLYLNQFAQQHPLLPELSSWIQEYCQRSSTEICLGDGPALDAFTELSEQIVVKYKFTVGSEDYDFLFKAAAECAVGCCIEINDTIHENMLERGENGLAALFAELRDGWDKFYDLAFKS